ncbi:MAG: SLBB domain-containing protein, partial [Bacteroidota bacterium]
AELDALRLRRGRSTIEDTVYFNNEIMIKSTTDITNVDFVGLIEKNDLSKDVKLHNGDKIVIPAKVYAVYVFGEVKNPGYITLKENAGMDYYIQAAGGYTESAQTGDIRIIKAGSKQWLLPNETTVVEGDFIWVPKEPYRTFEYYLNVYSQMFGIIGTVATLYLLIKK